jgi:hypothetical protein
MGTHEKWQDAFKRKVSDFLLIMLAVVLICETFGWVHPFEQLIVLIIVLVLAFLLQLGRGRG